MIFFDAEGFNKAVKSTWEQNRIDMLVKPQNSEFYYLKSLKFEDIDIREETLCLYKTTVKYKAEAKYQSKKYPKSSNKSESYSSSVKVLEYVESEGAKRIPSELYNKHKPKRYNFEEKMIEDVDQVITHDATLKIKGKVRRAGDMIEKEDVHTMKIVSKENERAEAPYRYFAWTALVNKKTGEDIGYATSSQFGAQYFFKPDSSKVGAEKVFKKEKPQKPVEAPKPAAPKKKKSSFSLKKALSSMITQVFVSIFIALAILLVEFVGLYIASAFTDIGFGNGGIADRMSISHTLKKAPGVYLLTQDNYDEFLTVASYRVSGGDPAKVKEGEKIAYVTRNTDPSMAQYPLFYVTAKAASVSIFDIGGDKAVSSNSSYLASSLFKVTLPKYVLTDLYVKMEVTYSYQGTEFTVETETYVEDFNSYTDGVIKVDFPEEIMESYTGTYVSNSKGDTYTLTTYYPDIDYWSVKIIEISGIAEVEEVVK